MLISEVWEWLQKVLPVLGMIAGPLLAWMLWSLRKGFPTHEECQQRLELERQERQSLQNALRELERRQTESEARLEQVPTYKSIHKMQVDLEKIRGEVSTVRAELDGLKEITIRVERMLNLLTEAHMKE